MKRLVNVVAGMILATLIVIPVLSACASAPPSPTPTPKVTPAPAPSPTAAPKATPSPTPSKVALPEVPIKYPGDTDATIIRRAQWIEGAKKEGGMSWWTTTAADLTKPIIAEFNKVYPFIKVEPWSQTGAEVTAKVEAEFSSGRFNADAADGSDETQFPRWRQMGILDKFTEIIPGIDKLNKSMYSRFGDAAIAGPIMAIPQYNTKLVPSAELPKSWEDLLDPRWKGQLGVNTKGSVWAILAVSQGGWGVEKTDQFVNKLIAQQPRFQRGFPEMATLLAAGEYKIAVDNWLHNGLSAQEKGAPVGFVKVSPVLVTGSYIFILKKAPHPNAARLFMEWLFSPQGLVVYENASGKGSPFPDSGTRASKAVAGLSLLIRNEDDILKMAELKLVDKYANLLSGAK